MGAELSEPSSLVSVKVGESSNVRPVLNPLGCLSIVDRCWRISLKAWADAGADTTRINGLEFAEYGPAPGERVSLGEWVKEGDWRASGDRVEYELEGRGDLVDVPRVTTLFNSAI